MERSIYVSHGLSLNSHLKPDKLYDTMKMQNMMTPRDFGHMSAVAY